MLRRRPAPTLSLFRASLFGIVLAAAAAVLAAPLPAGSDALETGDRAPHTITAPNSVQYQSQALTQAARDAAARDVPDVLTQLDPAAADAQLAALDRLFTQVRTIRTNVTGLQQQLGELNSLAAAAAISPTARTTILGLERTAFERFQERARTAVTEIMHSPVRSTEVPAKVDEYLQVPNNNTGTTAEQGAFREVVRAFVGPNVEVDTEATEQKRQEARATVAPQTVTFTRGQVIVSEGQTLTPADIEALEASGAIKDGFDIYHFAGGALLAAGLGVLLAAYLYLFQPFPAASGRRLLFSALAMVAALAAMRIALPGLTPDREQHFLAFALPLAAASLVVAGLADLAFAAVVAVAIGLFSAVLAAAASELPGSGFVDTLEGLQLALAYSAGGLAGAAAMHRAERLSRFGLAAGAISVATAVVLVSFWLITEPRTNDELGWIALASLTSGLGSAIIAAGIFVVLSFVFGVTTRIQLLELGQSGHPLLKRLQDEAPGTYHHSMMVGALAERAADKVGADALVTRVGAYYHDIGKLANPGSFIENQLEGSTSPHETLPPEESARIIRAHVKDGEEIARKYRLPGLVRDFIPQHHGTRLVVYFYRKAAQAGGDPDPADFAYAGPRPRSKEAAIVMLADSCEAIVRAHRGDGGSPPIEELVDRVLAERLAEGQLDESDITMRELQQVAESFKATLRAVYHPRIAYPSPGPEELARVAGN